MSCWQKCVCHVSVLSLLVSWHKHTHTHTHTHMHRVERAGCWPDNICWQRPVPLSDLRGQANQHVPTMVMHTKTHTHTHTLPKHQWPAKALTWHLKNRRIGCKRTKRRENNEIYCAPIILQIGHSCRMNSWCDFLYNNILISDIPVWDDDGYLCLGVWERKRMFDRVGG